MSSALFAAGERVEINGKAGAIHSIDRVASVIVYDDDRQSVYRPEDLYMMHRDGVLRVLPNKPANDPPDIILTEQQIKTIERLEAFLTELDKEEYPCSARVRKKVVERVGRQQGIDQVDWPSPSKLYRDFKKWREADRRAVALLRSQYRQRRAPRISDEIRRLIDDTLFEHFLVRNGKSRAECYGLLRDHLEQADRVAEIPSRTSFYKQAAEFDPIEVVRCREGTLAARKKSRWLKGRFLPQFLLERCELDAVHLKVGLLDDFGNYLGSVILFLLIDCYSRAIMGYSYTVAEKPAEQVADAIACIKKALRPKAPEDHPYLENAWPMHGKPEEMVMDASPAFACRAMTMFLGQLGITRQIAPTKEPYRRPASERVNRTLRDQFVCTLPGYVGSRGNPRENDESMQDLACLTVAEFEEALVTYLVDGYHQSSHRSLDDRTPTEVWNSVVEEHSPRPLLPRDYEFLNVFGGLIYENKQVHAVTGIELECIRYQSKALNEMYWSLRRHEEKPRLTILLDPDDVASITVINPETGEALEVGNVSGVAHGTTRREYKAFRKSKKRTPKHSNPITRDHHTIQKAEERQRERRRSRRRRSHPEPDPMTPQTDEQLHAQLDLAKPLPLTPDRPPVSDDEAGSDQPSEEVPPSPTDGGNFRVE